MKDSELPPLTEEEEKAAILEGRRKKYFKLKHQDYWAHEQEKAVETYEEEKRQNRDKSRIKKNDNVIYTR